MIQQIRFQAAEHSPESNVQLITSLLERHLRDQGVTVQVSISHSDLRILFEADQLPDRRAMVRLVRRSLQAQPVSSVQVVCVYGKASTASNPAWGEQLTLDEIMTAPHLSVVSPGSEADTVLIHPDADLPEAEESWPDPMEPTAASADSAAAINQAPEPDYGFPAHPLSPPNQRPLAFGRLALLAVMGVASLALAVGAGLLLLRGPVGSKVAAPAPEAQGQPPAPQSQPPAASPKPTLSPQVRQTPARVAPGTVTTEGLLAFQRLLSTADQDKVVKRISPYTCSGAEIGDKDLSVVVSEKFQWAPPAQQLEYARMLQQAWLSTQQSPAITLRVCSPLGLELARSNVSGVMTLSSRDVLSNPL